MAPRRLVLMLLAAFTACAAGLASAGDPALGERIYQQGILPSGQPLQASLQQGLPLSGAKAACSACHRRSGFGVGEGYTPIRPITGRYLFRDANAPHPRLLPISSPSPALRPAYSEASLARTLRTGIDTAGRSLAGMMPRYQMSEDDVGHLVAYLRTLSVAPDPGVSDADIHFATIVDASADPGQRLAMLEILQAYFRDKNAGTRLESERARRAPWDQARTYKAYRRWQLHVWTLKGKPETWPEQLAAYYRQQPVFAVLSGVGAGDWQPVHDFCDQTRLPCLFPNVDQTPQEQSQYALYLSRGLAMEAEALAAHLVRENIDGPIVQVFRDDTAATAQAFRQALTAAGKADLSDRLVAAGATPDAGYWQEIRNLKPAALVLWLKNPDLAALASLAPTPGRLYLSSRLAGQPALPDALAEQAALVYPWELPARLAPNLLRLHAWLRMKRIAPRNDPIQANTFYAVTLAGMAIPDLVDDYSRDYFIERIEHGVEYALAPSTFPHPSLGPGQRFASKGSYVVRQTPDGLQPLGDWIVP